MLPAQADGPRKPFFLRNLMPQKRFILDIEQWGQDVAGENLVSTSPSVANCAAFILVVDDELLVRMMVSDVLRDAGFQVIEAFNADEAISILQSGVRIDLMLSDVRMPGSMDGLGLLEYARDMFPALPVIITSGHLVPREALAKGAVQFLGKPYAPDHAIDLVKRELARLR